MSKGSIGNSEYEVFLSYCREDKHKARHVFEALGRQGWSVFMDQEIPNAERWEQHLQNQLERVPCVLVLWSSAAGPSVWVRREAQVGADRGVLVHATLDGAEPPATFSQLQATDLSTWDGGSIDADFLRLVSAVAMKVGTAGALGTLREPAPHEKITDDHIALASTSWRHHKKGDRRYVLYPFQIHLRLVGTEIALRRVENVIYYFDPAYAENRPDLVDPVRKAYVQVSTDWKSGFTIYDLANGYSVVRAAVKIRDQSTIVHLTRLVDIIENGPHLNVLYPFVRAEKD